MNDKYSALYEGILNNTELTTKNLKEMGYTRLTNLIDDGILKRVKRGQYELCNVHKLFLYGKQFERDDNDKYFEVLTKCVELDPNYGYGFFNLFLYALRKKDYNSSFNYLVKLMELGDTYKNDYNLYLLLLSRIIELPQEYQEKVSKLSVFDISVSNGDKRFKNCNIENAIRKAFFDEDYENASRMLNQFNTGGAPKVVYFQFLKKFIVKEKNEPRTFSCLEAAKNHDYLSMKQYIESLGSLQNKNRYLLKLINSYFAIRDTGLIPEVTLYDSSSLYVMLDSNDYEAAFDYVQNNSNKEKEPFYYLLGDILELIRVRKEDNIKIYTFDEVVLFLVNGGNYLYLLKKYLEQNNKSQYERLLLSFIELELYEKDTTFMPFCRHLYDVIHDRLNIDFSKYQLYFMQAIQDRDFNVARLYLNIIAAGKELKLNSINISSLEYSLDNKEREYKRKQSRETLFDLIQEVVNTRGVLLLDKNSIDMSVLNYYLGQYPNIAIQTFGNKVVLRYFEPRSLDIVAITREAEYDYKMGDYVSSIDKCMLLVNSLKFIKDFIYQTLGLSYYKLGVFEEAKKFLTISSLYGSYKNTILLDEIEKKLKEEELKRKREEK